MVTIYAEQGLSHEAKTMLRWAAAGFKAILGPSHSMSIQFLRKGTLLRALYCSISRQGPPTRIGTTPVVHLKKQSTRQRSWWLGFAMPKASASRPPPPRRAQRGSDNVMGNSELAYRILVSALRFYAVFYAVHGNLTCHLSPRPANLLCQKR